MPTYEYRCRDCSEHLEVVQSFRDDPLTECPHCSGTLKKVFQPIGIAFKGSGFYRNDSRSSASTRAGSGTSSGSDGAGDSSSSSDSSSGASSGSSESSSGASSESSSEASGSSDSAASDGKAKTA